MIYKEEVQYVYFVTQGWRKLLKDLRNVPSVLLEVQEEA